VRAPAVPTHAVTNDVVQKFSVGDSDEAWIVLWNGLTGYPRCVVGCNRGRRWLVPRAMCCC